MKPKAYHDIVRWRGAIKITCPDRDMTSARWPRWKDGDILDGNECVLERVSPPAGCGGFLGWTVWRGGWPTSFEDGSEAVCIREAPATTGEEVVAAEEMPR